MSLSRHKGNGATSMVDRLKDKTAIVFGAGSSGPGWGNGKAAAVAYARESGRVVDIAVVEAAVQETAGIIESENNVALGVQADVTRFDSVAAAVERALEAFGRI